MIMITPIQYEEGGVRVIEIRNGRDGPTLALPMGPWKDKVRPELDHADGDFRVQNVKASLKLDQSESKRLKVDVPRLQNGDVAVDGEKLARLVFNATLAVWRASGPGRAEAALAFFPENTFFKVVCLQYPKCGC